jgi:hypothetical protein
MTRPDCVLLLLVLATTTAEAHSWYFGLRDTAGRSCCNDQDCRPVGLCVLPDHKEGLLIEGTCRPIPWDKVLDIASPDGNAHACWNHIATRPNPNVLCVILPGQV